MSNRKISCARNLGILLLAGVTLVGCADDKPATEPTVSEPTQTVDWFKANDTERAATMAACSNNPGELKDDPNCVNAQQAEQQLSSGKPRNIW